MIEDDLIHRKSVSKREEFEVDDREIVQTAEEYRDNSSSLISRVFESPEGMERKVFTKNDSINNSQGSGLNPKVWSCFGIFHYHWIEGIMQ